MDLEAAGPPAKLLENAILCPPGRVAGDQSGSMSSFEPIVTRICAFVATLTL